MSARPLTIGAVLAQLQPDFPDISISKIRFLEAKGLVTPARTGSGYRTYTASDVDRLRYVLTAQRDWFWPLKVIADALDAMDRGLEAPTPSAGAGSLPAAPPAPVDPSLPSAADLSVAPTTLRLTGRELATAAGLDEPTVAALVQFGLLRADAQGHFDDAALAVARAAGALGSYGLEARHLRPFKMAADRELGLVQQVARPHRGSAADPEGSDRTGEVLAACLALHTALVRQGLTAR
ncbi:MerR family transcriptional regulator [Arsenicicoccus piscis]|uniref:MerR family transcriptional regulator n=1 Tax=Arsenicicoccus piscis TaxID=673954 RepID=A0ABQ6HMF4_9MICO|nr:MerR family transcriptional regulator [Arsenicicoccus piscis]MCH8629013.1 MerR family transcriptional regulator [Arsenicicoccus piscis]GMA19629.1 MerR family transcriptional regulator [Arsenicicoccus piscis]